jgi:5,10-methylene-tetrahydrofolate dehydrogenase/methenyl tetrahydrofolate cyclohydrolase
MGTLINGKELAEKMQSEIAKRNPRIKKRKDPSRASGPY